MRSVVAASPAVLPSSLLESCLPVEGQPPFPCLHLICAGSDPSPMRRTICNANVRPVPASRKCRCSGQISSFIAIAPSCGSISRTYLRVHRYKMAKMAFGWMIKSRPCSRLFSKQQRSE